MPQLPNPHDSKPFEKVIKDKNNEPEYGVRKVDGNEEIVHIPSGQSNMRYWQPEDVYTPQEHIHNFKIIDMGKREVECQDQKCLFQTTFIVGVNYLEEKGKASIVLKEVKHPVSL